jgi:hypothetical protein
MTLEQGGQFPLSTFQFLLFGFSVQAAPNLGESVLS